MAEIDTNLILAAGQNRSIDVPSLIQQGVQTYDSLKNIPLLDQKRQLQAAQMQQGQQAIQEQDETKKVGILLNHARALKALPPEQRRTYVSSLDSEVLGSFGIDAGRISSMQLDDASLDNSIAQLNSVVSSGQQAPVTSSAERLQRRNLEAAKGAYDESGQLKPRNQLTPEQTNALVELNVIPRLQGSATQTALELNNVKDVAGAGADIAGATTERKLLIEESIKPRIAAAVRKAETQAKARGEQATEYEQALAAFPGLMEVTDQLEALAPIATFSMGGKAVDALLEQTGFGSTEGADGRAKFISVIDNQVLPLLKTTFGAAFTEGEGAALKKTLGDPDASPSKKLAQIEAFKANIKRELERKKSLSGQSASNQPSGSFEGFKIRLKGQ